MYLHKRLADVKHVVTNSDSIYKSKINSALNLARRKIFRQGYVAILNNDV